ncbi:MAG TPA: hypothetical protein VF531_09135 [Bacillota bacterium]
MYQWRVTKYNPIFRDERGAYKKDEWTSISDVGKTYTGKDFTLDEYLKVEDLYVKAISEFMDSMKISALSVINLGKPERLMFNSRFESIYNHDMVKLYTNIQDDKRIGIEEVMIISRLVLRENLCCKLREKHKMFVHFGYDYYMYLGCSSKNQSVIQKIEDNGLFVEEYISPYR